MKASEKMDGNNAGRYLRITSWARRRYTKDGVLPVKIGYQLAPYTIIEHMAWRRYMAGYKSGHAATTGQCP